MKPDPPGPKQPKPSPVAHGAGSYICCESCGRLLRIEWAVRSLVCACGARVKVQPIATGKRA
jgi:hypothetical protein